MKTIIILGEEFWFPYKYEKYNTIGAENLKNKILEKNKDINIVILNSPRNIINEIEKYDNLIGVFLFHDVFSDSFVDNKSIYEMKNFFDNLEKKIYLYPGVNKTLLFGSKKYYKTLIEEIPYSSLPHSDVLEFKNYQGNKDEKIIKNNLIKKMKILFEKFDKIVVKKGFSYEGKQVKIFKKQILNDKEELNKKLDSLNFKKFFNVGGNAIKWEKNMDRYYILQGFNRKIKNNNLNEFRVFFLNGKAKYISWGDQIPNLCTDDSLDNYTYSLDDFENMRDGDIGKSERSVNSLNNVNKNLMIQVLRFAKRVYQDFKPKFWSNRFNITDPIIFRVDVSFAVDPIFQDEYSINIEGFDEKVRLYVNELEIDPTNFFYNYTMCKKDNTITSNYLEELVANYINIHIDFLK